LFHCVSGDWEAEVFEAGVLGACGADEGGGAEDSQAVERYTGGEPRRTNQVTFQEFCDKYNVTGHERKALRLYLALLRVQETLKL
jgi:hypothetical protein